MVNILKQYKKLEVGTEKLKEIFGSNLHNVEINNAEKIYSSDVVYLIKQYLAKDITEEDLLNWVNIVWFTDLYEYAPDEENSIASVMTLLEKLDENIEYSNNEYRKMISCLEQNKECEL